MVEDVKVPLLPESVSDAVVSKWHKNVGDFVSEGEIIAELETDKIMLEVPSMFSGKLTQILKKSGSHVVSDETLCSVDCDANVPDQPSEESKVDHSNVEKDFSEQEKGRTAIDQIRYAKENAVKGPNVRKVLYEQSIDEKDIVCENNGRISNDDLDAHIKEKINSVSANENINADTFVERLDRSVPMTRLRKTISKRLLDSQKNTASLTTFNEVDLSKVIDLRSKYKDEFKDKYGVKLGFMSFFTRACCHALHAFPEVNASVDGEDIIYHDYCDIGIAVSTEKGLLVPILRNAELLDMAEIEKKILDFSSRSRANKITLDELTGGTFSITNGGVFGSMLSTPILNPPQSAILGMHNIVKRPVVVDNTIEIRPMMYLALTYDHCIVDGSQAVRFLVMVKDLLEDPDRLLLQI
ncbi:MAG: 2-oxoglutarate dehydrogenase complex dihydrolipoyllysine-residue succinyltransferase [Pseudomonadota bacterium]|nr:2-oxoglutarate dehydrogenase complex dihydrolipoyllysine-residue succinyltransferase [Pseudomonadota bacterium]